MSKNLEQIHNEYKNTTNRLLDRDIPIMDIMTGLALERESFRRFVAIEYPDFSWEKFDEFINTTVTDLELIAAREKENV